MSEVVCTRIALNPGSLPLIREWARTLADDRRPEALATMIEEGVTVESYFLESRPEGDYLIAYMRADSLERAAASLHHQITTLIATTRRSSKGRGESALLSSRWLT